jgi:hypothetical protein
MHRPVAAGFYPPKTASRSGGINRVPPKLHARIAISDSALVAAFV